MTLTQVWGSLIIFTFCPLLGGLPLIAWITRALTGRKLADLGTGNISVSAAFYHGGKWVGILAVTSEALKGISAVLLAREFFPTQPAWELIALIALIMGRYWMGKGAGVTNMTWGILVHDPITALFVLVIGGISFTIFRDRTSGRLAMLFLLALVIALRHPDQPALITAAITLSGLIAWIYQKMPDDLNLSSQNVHPESQRWFGFFQGRGGIISLDDELEPAKVGQKAATLSQLKRWGYRIPDGWVIYPGDDPRSLIALLQPSPDQTFVVRSSALGEDTESASAAGQYISILNVTSPAMMEDAIIDCFDSYHTPQAVEYRRNHHQLEGKMAVLIQKQVQGIFSGVAFSRDPINQLNPAVVVEALPGGATQVVSGQVTPQQYQVYLDGEHHRVEGKGDLPSAVIEEVGLLARELERRFHGVPQDIEWSYDGQYLWLLQSRPITTLRPIWTRKIAAEVIPGLIKPLTWSINCPLTCGVWQEIFTLVLGKKASNFDFDATATLHYSQAYFNATLLGNIFLEMGLPPESLEFLTRGAKFSKPPLKTTIVNLPGLLRLLGREWKLDRNFQQDYQQEFAPILNTLVTTTTAELSRTELLDRIETILKGLEKVTYYSILAPLSLALRQKILGVNEEDLDNSQTPEVISLQALAKIAYNSRKILPMERLSSYSCPSLFAYLADTPDGEGVLEQFNQWLERYGYLSQVATDIAVPRWQEDPRSVRELFTQCLFNEQFRVQLAQNRDLPKQNWRTRIVQQRLNLKGQVTEIYSQLLAHLRWSILALGGVWLESGLLSGWEDIFYLQLSELRQVIRDDDAQLKASLPELVEERKLQLERDGQIKSVPYTVYGNNPLFSPQSQTSLPSSPGRLQGIGASSGQVLGTIKVLRSLESIGSIDRKTILVVPYTDSGWSVVLSLAGGLISEVGGKLSHGAIVAREYGIPAVMDIPNAMGILQDGQQVRIDGQQGIVEII